MAAFTSSSRVAGVVLPRPQQQPAIPALLDGLRATQVRTIVASGSCGFMHRLPCGSIHRVAGQSDAPPDVTASSTYWKYTFITLFSIHRRRRTLLRAIVIGAATLALPAFGAYPDKPVNIVVTFTAGGGSDIVARVMAEQLSKKLGQPFAVDNKPGAGGTISGALVTYTPPDGYTLMLSNTTPIAPGPLHAGEAALRPGHRVHRDRLPRRRAAGGDGEQAVRHQDAGRHRGLVH